MNNTVETLKAKIAARSTEELFLVVRTSSGCQTDREANIVRGFCLTELENRIGVEAVDKLMDQADQLMDELGL